MLVQCLLLMFGLLGIAAVAVDLGLARITQEQMQSGVDTAAMEGMRMRDDLPELQRRGVAREFAAATYANPDPASGRSFGAGPVIGLSGGETAANALQTISLSNDPQYRPCLALNLPNAGNGDMVSGTFLPEGNGPDEYTRDLNPDDSKGAFLVRMRRTGYFPEGSPDAAQPDPNCASSQGTVSAGPPVPLLFGMGSTVRQSDTSDYSVRKHGFTVRATAVAAGRPARRVAPEFVAPFTISRSVWAETTSNVTYTLTVTADGRIIDSNTGVMFGYTVTQSLTAIGDRFVVGGLLEPLRREVAYVPIYDTVERHPNAVVGYAFAYIASSRPDDLRFKPVHSQMAPGGASAMVLDRPGAPQAYTRDLYQKNSRLEYALQAPVLVR